MALFIIPVLFVALTDLGLVNLFYTKPQSPENMNSSNQQSCIYFERFSERKYNEDEQIANAIKVHQDADNDFLYCRSSFRKLLASVKRAVNTNFFTELSPF